MRLCLAAPNAEFSLNMVRWRTGVPEPASGEAERKAEE